MTLDTPIRQAGLTYRKYAFALEKFEIKTLKDLLYHLPHRYEDLSLTSDIRSVQAGETVTIQGKVASVQNVRTKRVTLQKVTITDDTGSIDCTWFNQPYITKVFSVGDEVSISGKAGFFGKKISISVKEYEIRKPDTETTHTGRLVPVYPETRGLSSKWIRNRIQSILKECDSELEEYLPPSLIQEKKLLSLRVALREIHLPTSLEFAEHARRRLAYDELLITQLAAQLRREEWKRKKTAHAFSVDAHEKNIEKLIKSLPFELTGAQKRAIDSIFKDVSSSTPMNRLLEGDVGSGKTVVSTIVMYLSYLNGFQSVLMAPTEILANQHYKTIHDLLSPLGIRVLLYTSASKKRLKSIDEFDIAVGTHALLDDKLSFSKLGLVVIDEQQRFGVEQRATLRNKGASPHFLTMTATPIPRTVLLTMYGDLELSFLNEMPKGRIKVKTWLVENEKRESGYAWIKKKIDEKNNTGKIENQVFVICPFIEESESQTTVKAATVEFERLKNDIFSGYSVGIIHGKLSSKDKQKVLEDFRDGIYDILVATPVVEVGIDIPNATIMLIEAAERYGLAQLHQLRGRVGRRQKESFCFLFTESESIATKKRLRHLETVYNGAELAEIDFKLRGPGDLYGTLQHGSAGFRIASYSDLDLIEISKKDSKALFSKLSSHPGLQERIENAIIQNITPD